MANCQNELVCLQCRTTGHRRGVCQMPDATTSKQSTIHPIPPPLPTSHPHQPRRAEPLKATKPLQARGRRNRRKSKARRASVPGLAHAAASDGVANHPTTIPLARGFPQQTHSSPASENRADGRPGILTPVSEKRNRAKPHDGLWMLTWTDLSDTTHACHMDKRLLNND